MTSLPEYYPTAAVPSTAKPKAPPGPVGKTPKDTAVRMLAAGLWPIPLYPPGVDIGRAKPTEGKEPIGKGWGLKRNTIDAIRARFEPHDPGKKFRSYSDAGIGIGLGPGRGPNGEWLADVEGDGPEAEESRQRLYNGEAPDTLRWGSARGGHELLSVDPARVADLLKPLKGLEGKGLKTGVYHLPEFPGLEIRFGGYNDEGTVKQVQSAFPPTPGTDGKPREWNGVATIAPAPESLYAALRQAAAPEPAPLFDMDAEIQRKRDQTEAPEPKAFDLDAEIEAKRDQTGARPILSIDEHLRKTSKGRPDDETRAGLYIDKLPPAISGNKGHNAAFKAACKIGPGFDLPEEVAFRLFWGRFNPRCDPPWSEKEARHKIADAYRVEARRGFLRDADRKGYEGNGKTSKGTGHAHEAEAGTVYEGPTDEEMGIVDVSEVKCENPVWLWDRRFLKGKINLIAGAGGDGKTTVAIMVGSVVTRGGIFPGGTPSGAPGRVLILAAEDGAGDTIKPRFIAAGADVSFGKVKVLTARVNIPKKGDRPAMVHPVCLQALDYWRWVFETHRPTVLIIDPLPAYLGRGVNDHKNADVQAALQNFAALANEFSVCVIAITHTGKATDRKLIHKVLGSVAYTNVARIVHVTLCDPDNPETRYLHRDKCNLDKPVNALSYKLVSADFERDGETFQSSRVEFDAEPVAIDAEAMANPKRGGGGPTRGPDPKKETAAAEWLHDFLNGRDGWTDRRDVIAAAGAAGIIGRHDEVKQRWSNLTMLYRAKDKRLPSLDAPRSGKRVDEEDMKTERDRYPRICWRLLDAEAAY